MNWTIPGTVLSGYTGAAAEIPQKFSAMFLGGGIALGQVAAVSGLEPYAVQNWVKRGFLPSPEKKKYDLNRLCRILQINALRNALSLEQICRLLQYINGALDDAADDVIDDAALYFLFVRACAATIETRCDPEIAAEGVLRTQDGLLPEVRARIKTVLCIMLTAYNAAYLRSCAEAEIEKLTIERS